MRSYLIVDDNIELAENLAEIVEAEGASVLPVGGAAAALEAVRGQRFDAVLTDMRMPVANGAQLVHQLRAIDPGLPACVMTAYTADDDLVIARHEGLLAIFGKPVPIEALLRTLAAARRDGLVALIEDDLALSDNLSELLRERGFGVVTAGSVTETDRLGPIRPFAAVVDLRVPEGPDGEALRRFAQRFPDVPRLVITAHHDPLELASKDRVFQKPFDTGEVLKEVEALHGARR